MDKKQSKKTIWDSRILWVIVSILASFLLWVYVTVTAGDDIQETYRDIPVEYRNLSSVSAQSGVVISEGSEVYVSVRVTGSRQELAKLKKNPLTASIDFSRYSSIGSHSVIPDISFPQGIDTNNVAVVATIPSTITFVVDRANTVPVEIRGSFVGSVAEGFSAEPMIFEPSTVTISGAASQINQVAYAYIEIDRDNVDKTIEFDSSYVLVDKDGNEMVDSNIVKTPETVLVTLPITATKELPLSVDLVYGAGATEENVKITYEPKSILVAGDVEVLDGINKISVGTIDLTSFSFTNEDTYKIVLDNGLTNLTGRTEVKITVQVIGLETKQFTVTNISTANLPAGRTATVVTESVVVTLRGDPAVLSQIQANNIRVVADLTDWSVNSGVVEPTAKVYVDGFTDVGAVGEYKVYVDIS